MFQILAVRRHRRRGGSASSGFPWRRSGPIRTIRGRPGRLLRRLVCASTGHAGQARIECAILCPIEESHPMERKQASDYPQELLNLFDHYVHGGIDRRAFLEGAQKFAVGGLTATAIWESLRPNYAWAQQVPKDDARIHAEYPTVPSPLGNENIRGY